MAAHLVHDDEDVAMPVPCDAFHFPQQHLVQALSVRAEGLHHRLIRLLRRQTVANAFAA